MRRRSYLRGAHHCPLELVSHSSHTGLGDNEEARLHLLRATEKNVTKLILNHDIMKEHFLQGRRITNFQQAVMLKRTFALATDVQDQIDADMLPISAKNMTITYTADESMEYLSVAKEPNHNLVRVNEKRQVMYTFAALRQIRLYSLSFIFVHLQDALTAEKCRKFVDQGSRVKPLSFSIISIREIAAGCQSLDVIEWGMG